MRNLCLPLLFCYLVGEPTAGADPITDLKTQAKQGGVGEQTILDFMYETGQKVPQDYAEAAKWYRKAAEQKGGTNAQFNLGKLYFHGRGVLQDYAEAAKWYRKAAEQGYAEAQINLGGMYFHGRGVPQDYVEAHKWANLAAAQQTGKDRDNTVVIRDGLADLMTPAQITEAQRLAREWKPVK